MTKIIAIAAALLLTAALAGDAQTAAASIVAKKANEAAYSPGPGEEPPHYPKAADLLGMLQQGIHTVNHFRGLDPANPNNRNYIPPGVMFESGGPGMLPAPLRTLQGALDRSRARNTLGRFLSDKAALSSPDQPAAMQAQKYMNLPTGGPRITGPRGMDPMTELRVADAIQSSMLPWGGARDMFPRNQANQILPPTTGH
jgi:hypothetical protein